MVANVLGHQKVMELCVKSLGRLEDLLLSLFGNNVDELKQFIHFIQPEGAQICLSVSTKLPMTLYTHEIVQQLVKREMLGIDFFGPLCSIRISREHEIQALWAAIQLESTILKSEQRGKVGDTARAAPPPQPSSPPPSQTAESARASQSGTSKRNSNTSDVVKAGAVLLSLGIGAAILDSHTKAQHKKSLYLVVLDYADQRRIKKVLRERKVAVYDDSDVREAAIERLGMNADLINHCLLLNPIKSLCSELQLSTYGTKRELSERIADWIEEQVDA